MGKRLFPQLWDAEWLRMQYVDAGKTQAEMAAEIGCNPVTVTLAMRRFGIPVRVRPRAEPKPKPGHPTPYWQLLDPAWLRQRYEVENKTLTEMAAEIGCGRAALIFRMDEYGIPRLTPQEKWGARGTKRVRRFPQLTDAAWLRQEYDAKTRTCDEIADEIGCSQSAVWKALHEHSIPARKAGAIRQGKQRPDASIPFSADGRPRKRYHNGYIKIHAPDHPAADSGGYVPEHRWVAEQTLGRLLKLGEIVHHHDKDTGNNDPANLMVFPSHRAHKLYHDQERKENKAMTTTQTVSSS